MEGNGFAKHFSTYPTRTYAKGRPLINPGQSLKHVHQIKKGYVRMYTLSGEGKELTLIIFKPGEFFPILAAYMDITIPWWIETMTPVEISTIPVADFLAYCKDKPEVLKNITAEIIGRLLRMFQRMEHLAFGNAEEKVANMLLVLAERFGEHKNGHLILNLPLTHRELAHLVGMTREKTSSVMSQFAKDGYIGNDGKHIFIKNKNALLQQSSLDHESLAAKE